MSDVPHGANGTEEQLWYIDEGVPGTGPRPDYLQPKYKSLAEQAKAYPELRKSLGAMTGAPDQYSLDDFATDIDVNSPHLKGFLDYAKQNRFSQEAVSTTLKSLVDYEKSMMPDENAEMEKLGPEGQKKRGIIDQWAKNSLSPDAQKVYDILPKSAEVLTFMDELRQKSIASSSNPPSSTSHNTPFKPLTEAEVRQEMRDNYEKYQSNPGYREEIRRKLEQCLGVN
jgi:hypothetical protein